MDEEKRRTERLNERSYGVQVSRWFKFELGYKIIYLDLKSIIYVTCHKNFSGDIDEITIITPGESLEFGQPSGIQKFLTAFKKYHGIEDDGL